MININGTPVDGLEQAKLIVFGSASVSGIAQVAADKSELDQARFYADQAVVPILAAEAKFRSLIPPIGPTPFEYLRMINPAGLVTFGADSKVLSDKKKHGTHLDILLREWAEGDFLGVVVEGIYRTNRLSVIDEISQKIGGRAVRMFRTREGVSINTQVVGQLSLQLNSSMG